MAVALPLVSTFLEIDCYTNGKRRYEFLKLYLIPETDEGAKNLNQNTLQAANAIKAQRLISLTNEGAGIKSNPQLSKMLLMDWFELFVKKQRERGLTEATLENYQKFKGVLTQFKKHTVRLCDIDKAFYLSFIQFLKNDYKGGSGRKKEDLTKKESEEAPRKLTPTSIRSYCTMLNAVLNGAVKAGIMVANPFRRLDNADMVVSEFPSVSVVSSHAVNAVSTIAAAIIVILVFIISVVCCLLVKYVSMHETY